MCSNMHEGKEERECVSAENYKREAKSFVAEGDPFSCYLVLMKCRGGLQAAGRSVGEERGGMSLHSAAD